MSLNCWEFMKCGYEPGGEKVEDKGICPAYPDKGQCCAHVAGTLCGDKVQRIYAIKLKNCLNCKFFNSRHYDLKC